MRTRYFENCIWKYSVFFLSLFLGILMFGLLSEPASVLAAGAVPGFSGGDGSQQNPYLISSEEELAALSDGVNTSTEKDNFTNGKYFQLEENITLTKEFIPIGYSNASGFQGIFDGNGKTITLSEEGYADGISRYYQGLFGYADHASIHDLNVKVPEGSSLRMQSAYTKETGLSHDIGGIVGSLVNGASMERCSFEGDITIVYVTGDLDGGDVPPSGVQISYLGGIAGSVKDTSVIDYCYSIIDNLTLENETGIGFTDLEDSAPFFGGIVGSIRGMAESKLSYCYTQISQITYTGDLWFFSEFRPGGIAGMLEKPPSTDSPASLYHSYYSASLELVDESGYGEIWPLEGDMVIFSKNYPEGTYSSDAAVGSREEILGKTESLQAIFEKLVEAGGNYEMKDGKPVPIPKDADYAFLVSIPASVSLNPDSEKGTTFSVKASEVMLQEGQSIGVQIVKPAERGYFELVSTSENPYIPKLRYDAYRQDGSKYDFKAPLCSFTDDGTQQVTYRLQNLQTVYAGSYTGTVQYEIEVAGK